jgi:hypothetical protein
MEGRGRRGDGDTGTRGDGEKGRRGEGEKGRRNEQGQSLRDLKSKKRTHTTEKTKFPPAESPARIIFAGFNSHSFLPETNQWYTA